MVLSIAVTIIFPIFAMIGVGALVNWRFALDIGTLSRLNFYVFVPALVFSKLSESALAPALYPTVVLFSVVHLLLLLALSRLLFSVPAWRAQRPVLTLGALFYNAGNFGLPLVVLAFGDAGVDILVVLLLTQNLLNFTLGIALISEGGAGAARLKPGQLALAMLRTPVVIAILLAFLLRALGLTVPQPLADPVRILSQGLVPVALLTLGAQLTQVRLGEQLGPLAALNGVRLIVSPLLALLMVLAGQHVLGLELLPLLPVLVVAAGLPVAVNVFILATEYERQPELASQAVFSTTLLGALTITGWLVVTRLLVAA